MITADRIRRLAYLSTTDLEQMLARTYPQDQLLGSRFLGITNGREFCYEIQYFDQHYGENTRTKVFVNIDSNDNPVATYFCMDMHSL